ncbi:hypothetical protein GCM10008956_36380 [Deinococcus arenae]|uniref:Glycosyl transferase n=1 Tax=Deinococcus arenae TaxID=1452751 RepID=A0A8H9LD15_9DEIO|nr:hypothetical protein GCM10008956_36380 [Deinococcus arenae]
MISSRFVSFTIVNGAYYHYALTLAQSYLDKNPESLFYVFYLGEEPTYIPDSARTIVKVVDEEMINDLKSRAFYYEITELSTSIKPNCFRYLGELGFKKIIYLDPDIFIYKSLEDIDNLLENQNIIITPHSTEPIYDGLLPDDLSFLRSGSYNLGFIAIRWNDKTKLFIDWWMSRLRYNAFNAFSKGMFTDQKWIDLIPSFFDGVYILKDSGYNVAYWNLHSRKIELEDGEFKSNGGPLYFFHFSGISLNNDLVSKYSTRYSSYYDLGIDIIILFERYKAKLLENYGITESQRKSQNSYNYFGDGELISELDRLIYLNYNVYSGQCIDASKITRKEFYRLIQSTHENRISREFTYDPRLGKISQRISRLPAPVKSIARSLSTMNWVSKIVSLTNNSVNKINTSQIIYALYKEANEGNA